MTSLRSVCSTVTLSKDESFTKKYIRRTKTSIKNNEFLAIMTMNFSVYLMSISEKVNSLSLYEANDHDQVHIPRVVLCGHIILKKTTIGLWFGIRMV